MRILYSAIDQSVPAAHGGSVHVTSVAEGLASLGNDVHVFVSPGPGGELPTGAAHWHALPPPLGDRRLRLLRALQLIARAKALRPDVVIERYYNFGGEGLLAARQVAALAVLEVNAPIEDYPGSMKSLVDRLLIAQPLRRWRNWQCDAADVIVTPTAAIIPPHVPSDRIFKTEWGADTELFRPAIKERSRGTTVIFAGAFRAWHGAIHLVDALKRLRSRGRTDIKAVLVGAGPELARVQDAARGLDGVSFTGAVAHARVPALLAGADIGVAPFDVAAHPSLAYEFHWSPLKIFEYMAAGLPVVAPRIARLREIVESGKEGLLYDASNPDGLAWAIEQIADSPMRDQMGRAARARAVDEFSWQSHCLRLDQILRTARRHSDVCAS